MRLPRRQGNFNTSMAATMRSPITRRAPMAYRAATQRQVKMPTNYDQVGKAWANAALAQGRMGMAIAEAGQKFVNAGLEIEYNNQKADTLTKKSELKSFIAGFVTEQNMRQDLMEMGENGDYNYNGMEDSLTSALASFEKSHNNRYKITDPQLQSAYMSDRMGMLDAAREELAKLRMSSHNGRVRGEADTELNKIRSEGDYLEWEEAYGSHYSPENLVAKRQQAQNQWNGEALRGLASESYDINYLTGDGEGSHMHMIDQMYINGDINEATANRQRAVAKARVGEVTIYFKDQIANSRTPDEVEAWSEAAYAAGALNLQEIDKMSKTSNSRNSSDGIMSSIIGPDGKIVDSPLLLAEANSALDQGRTLDTISKTDYAERKAQILTALESRSDEKLTAMAVGSGGYAAVEQAYKNLDTVDPKELGFSGTDDPYWTKYKASRKTLVATLKQKYEEKELEYTKDMLKAQAASSLAFGTTTVSNVYKYEANGQSVNAGEVKEEAWRILTSMSDPYKPDNPVNQDIRLAEFVAKHKYVPKEYAEQIKTWLDSGDPEKIGMGLALADRIDSFSKGEISRQGGEAFENAEYAKAFEMAEYLFTTLDGININTELGREMYRDVMNNYLNRTQVDEKVAEGMGTDFLEKVNLEDAIKKYGDGDELFDAMFDKAVGSSEIMGVMKSVYTEARAAGKDHKNSARLAVGVARNTFSWNDSLGEIERDSINHKHQFAGTEELEWSLRDFATGQDRLTPEDIEAGYSVHPDDARDPEKVRWQKLKDEGWLMVDEDGRPVIQRLQDLDGAVVPNSARLVIVREDQLSAQPQEQVRKQQAEQVAKASEAVVENTKKQLEERLEVAIDNAPTRERKTQRGTRTEADPDALPPVQSWQIELEAQVQEAISDGSDAIQQETARLQAIVLQEARLTGLSQETVVAEMERIEKEVRMKAETKNAINPEPEDDLDVGDDMDGDGTWEVDLKGQRTEGQDVEESERGEAMKDQIREMRKAAKEKRGQ